MDRIIGLDLGSKTCGVSICDALHITCRALTTVRFESDDYDACLEEVLKLLQENKVKEVVLGLPKHMNGDIGIRGEISCEFAIIYSKISYISFGTVLLYFSLESFKVSKPKR